MHKKIKVLQCIRQGQIGGGESHLLSLCENLDRSVFEPIVLSFTDGPMIERLQALNIPAKVIFTERPFDISKWQKVKTFLKEQQVDLIHAHGTRANSNILWAARSLHIPLVYTIHGWSFHQDQPTWVQYMRIMGERYLTQKSNLNISVSYSNQQSGKRFLPSFESIIINNGIDLNKFDPNKKYKNVKEELGIANDTKLVLFCARFLHQKQPLSLIRAFAQAIKAVPAMHLLMVGDGDEKKEAEALIKELKLEGFITLQSFRQDVPHLLASADVFVLPSLWEGLPISLLEALAMGKAVIATDVDGTNEIIEHGKNGYLIKTQNLVGNLQQALVDVVSNDNLQRTLSQNAIQTVKSRFDAGVMTRQIEEAYKRILNKLP